MSMAATPNSVLQIENYLTDNFFLIQFELEDTYMIRAIIIMQDIRVKEPFDKNIMLNYHVRVGNDPDSLDDYEYCDGSPY